MPHDPASIPKARTYRALVDERAFDVTFRDGRLLLDGEAVPYVFEPLSDGYFALLIDGRSLPVVIEPADDDRLRVTVAGRRVEVQVQDEKALLLARFGLNEATSTAGRLVRAPMPGLVLRVMVEPGQQVHTGDGLVVLEAMKMENELRAHIDGVVKTVYVAPGDAVRKNEVLVELGE